MMRLGKFVVVAALVALTTSAVALAQGPLVGAYGGKGGGTQGGVEGAGVAGSTGSLPFTGLDLAFVVVAAVALIGAGFVVRRGARSRA